MRLFSFVASHGIEVQVAPRAARVDVLDFHFGHLSGDVGRHTET